MFLMYIVFSTTLHNHCIPPSSLLVSSNQSLPSTLPLPPLPLTLIPLLPTSTSPHSYPSPPTSTSPHSYPSPPTSTSPHFYPSPPYLHFPSLLSLHSPSPLSPLFHLPPSPSSSPLSLYLLFFLLFFIFLHPSPITIHALSFSRTA